MMTEKENDNVGQRPRMIRVPCHARNVSDTHTPQTAYFEFPEDITHGKIICCSHKLCRESGRQFRFCKVCNKVCAKRNFSCRHGHMDYNENILKPKNEETTISKDETTSMLTEQTSLKNGSEEPFVMMRVSQTEAGILKALRRRMESLQDPISQNKEHLLRKLKETINEEQSPLASYCQPINFIGGGESIPDQEFKKQLDSIRSIGSSKIEDLDMDDSVVNDLGIDISITDSGRSVAQLIRAMNQDSMHSLKNCKDCITNKKSENRMQSLGFIEFFREGFRESVANMEMSNMSL